MRRSAGAILEPRFLGVAFATALLGVATVVGAAPRDRPAVPLVSPADEGRPQGGVPTSALSWIPRYPGAEAYPMGTGEAIRGLPVTLSHFESRDSPSQIADWYFHAFRKSGLWPSIEFDGANGRIVCATNFATRSIAAVAIFPHGEGSDVFPATVDIEAAPPTPRGETEMIPVSVEFPMFDALSKKARAERWGR